MQKVWITGAAGQIGTAINDVLDAFKYGNPEYRSG